MSFKTHNQKPQVLSPLYQPAISGDFDPYAITRELVADPIMTPQAPNANVTILENGTQVGPDEIVALIFQCCGDTVDPDAELRAKDLLARTLVWYERDVAEPVDHLFVTQAGMQSKLPEPTQTMIYTPAGDVIPASKQFLAGQCDFEFLFASLAYYARPTTLGFAFNNKDSFDAFKTWLDNETSQIVGALPPETVRLLTSFRKDVELDQLTESLRLRTNVNDQNDPASFARLIIAMLMKYASSVAPNECHVCPFSMSELVIPQSVVFVNIEEHMQAQPRAITDEWRLINDALANPVSVMRPGQIQKLTTMQRNLQKAAAAAAASAIQQQQGPAHRSSNVKFKKTPPTATDITRIVKKLLHKMARVNHSQNIQRQSITSFARANRRDPDDFNRPGRATTISFLPDIHLYVDTSGSISEAEYQDAVKSCIKLTQGLGINLYFNSFSHVLSTSTLLPTKGLSATKTWRVIQKIPKVTGGTDYEQIWRYIMASKKRRQELSLIITDFEYSPPTRHCTHPKNLYYIPISTMNWERMIREASRYVNSMRHIAPDIREHVLF